jgi:hypothetical protein
MRGKMNLLIKFFLTAVVIGMAYFAIARIWTKDVDILAFLRKPSESIPVKEATVVVVPTELNLSTSDWGKTRIVEIKNAKSAVTVYSVWIKLKAQNPEAILDDIQILSETGQEFVSESFSGINVNFDLIKISALDSDKQPCVYLLIYKLKGLESRFFKLKKSAAFGDAVEASFVISLKVIGFSENSAPIATKDGAAALQISPPETMTIKAISMLLKKDT